MRTFIGVLINLDHKWTSNGEGSFLLIIDAEERRCRKKIGLDTLVSYTVNDEW